MQNAALTSCALLSQAVHDNTDLYKTSCRVATVLEEQFIAAGWPTGELFGTDETLARRFNVGDRIIDEAVHILAMRGTARLRRTSSNLVGLEVTAPPADQVVDILCGYAFLAGVNVEHRREAIAFLEAVRRRLLVNDPSLQPSQAFQFLSHFFKEHLVAGAPPKGLMKERVHKFRAGQIANRILDCYFGPTYEPGCRVGSEAELSSLYRADRSITRQAIRLLESGGLVTTLPGRGNGIFTRRPTSAPVSRLLCCYFAAHAVPIAAAFDEFRAMSIEAVALAAQKACAEDVREFERTFAANWACGRVVQQTDIYSTEDCLFSAVRNPLIELCLRTLRGYVALVVDLGGGNISAEMANCFVDYTRQVLDAMVRHDPDAAAAAHERKLIAMRELEGRNNPALARLLYAS